ncbi:MAG: molecular chaperone DnaJ [Coriobacteriia bacterium]|nr:molecular chaperone DnaJ [Coriobacteriia bacterium]
MSAGTKDHYAVLGVERTATEAEIKKAFRRKARECHPDVCSEHDAEERFKSVNEAYDVLSDPSKREMYDRYGTVDPRMGGGGRPDLGDVFGGFGMEDLFSVFFGGVARGASRRARTQGRDMAVQVMITLEEAAEGVDREIAVNRLVPCDECGATGSSDGSGTKECSECGGAGQRRTQQRTFLGVMQTVAPCERCSATGQLIESPCAECAGQGRVPDRDHVSVEIPAGIDDGMQIRMRGMGEAGFRGAAAGDLLVTVRVPPHEFLHREGSDLHARMSLTITEAALGAEMEVPGIDGDVTVTVPAGTQYGDQLSVRGAGMPRLRGSGRGDLFVHAAVEVPRKLTKEQREILGQLAGTFGEEPRATPLDRLKEWLTG